MPSLQRGDGTNEHGGVTTVMRSDHTFEINEETLLALRSLVQSVQVSLSGLDSRMKRELEVISVSSALAARISDILEEIRNHARDPP
jgi:hypothetical protein